MISRTMPMHAHGPTQPTFRFPHTGLPETADDDPCSDENPCDPYDDCDEPCDGPSEPGDVDPEVYPDFCRRPLPRDLHTLA